MRTFIDSSAFAKRYVDEPGSQAVDDICRNATELGLSVICIPEIVSALNRRVRERVLSPSDYAIAKRRLSEDVADSDIVNLTPAVISGATTLLEHSPLRALDALHIACALAWKAEIFVTSDEKQMTAARKVRLRTRRV